VRVDGEGLVLGVEGIVLGLCVGFGEGNGAAGADATGSDIAGAVAEDVAGYNVHETDDNGETTRSNEKAPERHAERRLARSFFVHVAQHVETENHHGAAETHKAVAGAQKRPVAGKEAAEEGALGDDEEEADSSGDNVAGGVKEEELGMVSVALVVILVGGVPLRR
jgi:hypothetical protein